MQTGQQISLLRKQAKITQQELAEKLFVSRELVSKWETGTLRPPYEIIIEIAKIFSVFPDEIINADEEIAEADYEPELLEKTMCSYWEDRPMKSEYNVEIKGWEYRAGVEIYKLKNFNPEEAVAAKISFSDDTKIYKFTSL